VEQRKGEFYICFYQLLSALIRMLSGAVVGRISYTRWRWSRFLWRSQYVQDRKCVPCSDEET
jgi:hypothetical protein